VPGSRCPTCRRPVPPRQGNPAFPFCSPRCKLVDLGRWFGEEYRVAGEPAGDGEAGKKPEGEDR